MDLKFTCKFACCRACDHWTCDMAGDYLVFPLWSIWNLSNEMNSFRFYWCWFYIIFGLSCIAIFTARSWGKVIFSEACVKNSVRGGGMHGREGMPGRGCAWQGEHAWQWEHVWQGERAWQGGCVWQRGTCMIGGHVWRGACMVGVCMIGGVHGRDTCVADTTRYSQWAGGTHPTGIHSCSSSIFLGFQLRYINFWKTTLLSESRFPAPQEIWNLKTVPYHVHYHNVFII